MQGFDYCVIAKAIMWDPLKNDGMLDWVYIISSISLHGIYPTNEKFLSNFVVLGSQFNYFD